MSLCPVQEEMLWGNAVRSNSSEWAPWLNPICLEMLLSQNSYETICHLAVVMEASPRAA